MTDCREVVGSTLNDGNVRYRQHAESLWVFIVGRWNVQAAGIEPKAVEMAVMQAYPISRQGTTLCQIQERVSQDREHQEKQRYAGQQKLTLALTTVIIQLKMK